MSPRTVERVDDWDTVPFGGGYGGLRDLASQEFSGVATAGPAQLFMIRGTVVGVLEGSIDDFEESSGNAREAPHPALPLLAVMQERSDEVRAKYYTEDTPISDVDRTLADGSFTGYVELSENVLSGDYYQVYHQGRSMSVAYVGSAERLITDDEAFDQANDEVGIYEVRPVAIEAIDVPEPTEDADSTADASATDTDEPTGDSTADEAEQGSVTDDADEAPDSEPNPVEIPSDATDSGTSESRTGESDPGESETGPRDSPEPTAGAEADETTAESGRVPDERSPTSTEESQTAPSTTGAADSGPETDPTASEPDDSHPGARASSSTDQPPSSTDQTSSPQRSSPDRGTATDEQSSRSRNQAGGTSTQPNTAEPERSRQSTGTDRVQTDQSSAGDTQSNDAGHGSQNDGRQSNGPSSPGPSSTGSATDLEVRSIPSLDPTRTEAASKTKAKQASGGRSANAAQQSQSERSKQGQQRTSHTQDQPSTSQTPDQSTRQADQQSTRQPSNQSDHPAAEEQSERQETAQQSSHTGAEAKELASELESREQEVTDLRTDLERVEAERDELETELTDLEAERDRLQTELEEAQAEIGRLTERLEDFAADGAGAAETRLSAGEAIDNTNLFVRYKSKGDATLETAHSGNADRSAVAENMRLEYHTQFDADTAAVGNESFDDFFTGTIQYRFVDWITSSLLYEIRDTGHADGMADLYNALPKIDRAELNGQVSVNYTEDGEEHRSQERFDVVVRDRMGNPLAVANINNSRDPATDAMMTDLVKRAERVGESSETLAGAFLVTESFFEPEALETAEGATSSGLFSRDRRKSFVNLSRKGGYHLCLVEARNEEFHLAVPEL